MERIVVAVKAGADQPWVADAAVQLAKQTGAGVNVVSVDGVDVEMLSPLPRSAYAQNARESADKTAELIKEQGVEATADTRSGKVVPGILLYAEEQDADVIIVGASTLGRVARRILGNVPLELVERSRRPVLIVSAPGNEG
jgi:nucleotide-binding universal stress UspA family protein